MRKLIVLFLSLVLSLTFVACGNKEMSEEESLDKFIESDNSLSAESVSQAVVNEKNFTIPSILDLTQFTSGEAIHMSATKEVDGKKDTSGAQEAYLWIEQGNILKGSSYDSEEYSGFSLDLMKFFADAEEYIENLPSKVFPGSDDSETQEAEFNSQIITSLLEAAKLTKEDLESQGKGVYLIKKDYFNKLITQVAKDPTVLVAINGFFKTSDVELTIKQGLLTKLSIDLKSTIDGLFDITGSVEFSYKKEVVTSVSGNLNVTIDLTKMGDQAPASIIVKGKLTFKPKDISLDCSVKEDETLSSIEFKLTDKSAKFLFKVADKEMVNLNANWTEKSFDLNLKYFNGEHDYQIIVKLDKSQLKVTANEGQKEVVNVAIILNEGKFVSGNAKVVVTTAPDGVEIDTIVNMTLGIVNSENIPAQYKNVKFKEITFDDIVNE